MSGTPSHSPNINSYNRSGIEAYAALEELALDMHWSWSHKADEIWNQLDPDLWELTHNPWVVLQTVSKEKLESTLANPGFRKILDDLILGKREEDNSETWFQKNHPNSPVKQIAYFCMEYMLSEALPIYSGGLGNVAGDQLKAASDLGVPVIAIGLLYQKGYFRQMIDSSGRQLALYPYNDPGQLPIMPLRKPNGEWLRLKVSFPGWSIWVRAWQVIVGRIKLLLLDSNDAANFPPYRAVTSELYGGDPEVRLQQEMLLGIGGWRLLEALNIEPEVCHLNEGHAAFAILERARSFMQKTGLPFQEALSATRAGNLFTTHTAVSAGFDRFAPDLMEKYLSHYASQLGLSFKELLSLGRHYPLDDREPFNMAYLAIRGSGAVNGVSQLHGEVSRRIFEPLFPRWPEDEVPVGCVTNGVHMASWDSAAADAVWTRIAGKNRWRSVMLESQVDMGKVSDEDLWKMRADARAALIEYTRHRLALQLAARGMPFENIEEAKHIFDENTLTIGFARRFATYKRPNMLLHDPQRLLRILNNSKYPVQLILAGKAHPADKPGQALIQEWMHFIRDEPHVRSRVIFLSDYDMLLTEKMVQGVDLWINTPRRPWEACGTSGMKVLVNGGLNISELDGWWAEAYSPNIGWAIGDKKERGEDLSWDAAEAYALYEILENEIIPAFYCRDNEGMSSAWLSKMRESMSQLTPRFSANRAVRDYTEKYYLPAALGLQDRIKDRGSLGTSIVQWKRSLAQNWEKIRLNDFKCIESEKEYSFELQIYLDGIDARSVKVEIFAEKVEGKDAVHQEMTFVRSLSAEANFYIYRAAVLADRPQISYSVRVIPFFPGVAIPLEESHILWQK